MAHTGSTSLFFFTPRNLSDGFDHHQTDILLVAPANQFFGIRVILRIPGLDKVQWERDRVKVETSQASR